MPNLILIPTPFEEDFARGHLETCLPSWTIETVGFGLVAAAANTSRWIHQHHPERIMLIGIAGSYDEARNPIATAARFDEIVCDGIGVGTEENFLTAGQMGWDQWHADSNGKRIGDRISLKSASLREISCAGELVSVCAASENIEQATRRQRRYPNATAEDMEAFGVAVAAVLHSVPLQVIRGFSNRAGERNRSQWKIEEALAAACDIAVQLANRPW